MVFVTLNCSSTNDLPFFLFEINENVEHEWSTWLPFNSHIYDILYPFFSLGLLECTYDQDEIEIRMKPDCHRFNVIHSLRYTIPWHESLIDSDYYRYAYLLYTCENSNLYSQKGVFIDWFYEEIIQSTVQLLYTDKDTKIYPGVLWILEYSDTIIREQYKFNVVQQLG
jgi:hypothetical protein